MRLWVAQRPGKLIEARRPKTKPEQREVGPLEVVADDLVVLARTFVGTGYIAVRIGELYVEFRTQDGWDSGISRPAVLIHRLVDPNAVVLASDPTNHVNDWQPGQTYGPSPLELAIHGGTQITVVSFDLPAKKARISVVRRARPPVSAVGPGTIIGGVGVDGGGIIVLPSGKVVRVPPHWPVISLLEKLAVLADTEVLSTTARRAVEAAVLGDVARTARRLGKERQG
jgi:hypothetical protein